MEHIIEGILIKYNEPILDRRTVIKPGAFDKHRVDSVPLLKDFDYKDKAVGTAELQYEEDGVYYTGMLFDTDESDEIIRFCLIHGLNIGLNANKIEWEHRDSRNIVSAALRAVAFAHIHGNVAKIFTIDGEDVEALREKAIKETKKPTKTEILANLREDIDLLTYDRQPTAEEMKIINDISSAIAMLEEQS